MRLFIAFDVPDDVSKLISDTQAKIIIPGKATLTKSFHLTLKFLGDVEEEKLSVLTEELKKIQFQSFTAKLSTIGAFPNTNNPRVVWIGLEPHDKINAIQKEVGQTTQKLGFKADDRFHPHLTLARIKFLNNKKQFQDTLDNLKAPEAEFKLDSFKLIKSTLTPVGPKYDVLESFPARH